MLDFSKQNGVRVKLSNVITSPERQYTRATFSRTKASAKWSVTTTTLSRVTSPIQISAQFRLFQVKAMFKQHVNLMIWTWILRLQTASRNECPCKNIGITHVFSCINICRVPRMLFEHEADRPSVQHHPRDPASVNAMKQTCVIVILAYFTLFQLNSHWKRC